MTESTPRPSNKNNNKNKNKVVVFDLDETLGHFLVSRTIWDALTHFLKYNHINYPLSELDFEKICEIFPEIFRPNLFEIMNIVKKAKQDKKCRGVYLYTNNRYDRSWSKMIVEYIDKMTATDPDDPLTLFDRLVLAFKINGVVQEPCRTSSYKRLTDFYNCCRLPSNTHVCFFDDTYFGDMDVENVYYVKVKPYFKLYTRNEIKTRLETSELIGNIMSNLLERGDESDEDFQKVAEENKKTLIHFILEFFKIAKTPFFHKTRDEHTIDEFVSVRMKTHLYNFFE